ncbi:hypothetical protein [Longivirga aurantiaca]|uniref:Uncharacterized protein n=1 Tax=Longivirga aurantiaca TaxID=1837743 RepID=A0ABW1T2H8_9ACTN
MSIHVPVALRRAVLSLTLTEDGAVGDLQTRTDGVVHTGVDGDEMLVRWPELFLAVAHDGPGELTAAETCRRVGRWLRLRIALHDLMSLPGTPLEARARVLAKVRLRALPPDHPVHPGPSWPRRAVLGGALDVGLALRGVDDDGRPEHEAVGVLPAGVLIAAGIDVSEASMRAERHLSDMAVLASERVRRDTTSVLRPLGDADVLTLLASAELRAALVEGHGMRTAAVPVRNRGWLDLGRIDPAFAISAAEITEPDERGFIRPVLITKDEVALIRSGGDPVAQSLSDPSPEELGHPPRRRLA